MSKHRKEEKAGMLGKYRQALSTAILDVEKGRRETLMRHMVERAFIDDTVLIALLKKLVPDLKSVDIKTDADSARQVIIMNFADYALECKSKD